MPGTRLAAGELARARGQKYLPIIWLPFSSRSPKRTGWWEGKNEGEGEA